MKYDEIANDITANAAALNSAVQTFTAMPARSKFILNGSLMACMAQIDLMSMYEFGIGKHPKGHTGRMRGFMERYLDAQRVEEHRVAIQLMRHTLMHTGSLRFLYDKTAEIGYTWRIHFGDRFPARFTHYTLTNQALADEPELVAAAPGHVVKAMALNLNITEFAADIQRVAGAYVGALRADPVLQTKCEGAHAEILVQELR